MEVTGKVTTEVQIVQQTAQQPEPEGFANLIAALLEETAQVLEGTIAMPEQESEEKEEADILITVPFMPLYQISPEHIFHEDSELKAEAGIETEIRAENPLEQLKNSLMAKTDEAETVNLEPEHKATEKHVMSFEKVVENLTEEENKLIGIDTTIKESEKTAKDNSTEKTQNVQIAPSDEKSVIQKTVVTEKVETSKTEEAHITRNLEKIEHTIIKEISTVRENSTTTLSVKLEPETLGKMDLDITMEDGKLSIRIQVESEHVKTLLNGQLNQLTQAVAKQDVQISRITLAVASDAEKNMADQNGRGNFRHNYKRRQTNVGKIESFREIGIHGAGVHETQQGLNVLA
ncbi:MAG: flagellar hook-length control protein FliK [Gudongella sp.]|jgi:flagellar hook-length control protein FliK|nr:flagellar hook-length control protein FliK [Gudongella sp.]